MREAAMQRSYDAYAYCGASAFVQAQFDICTVTLLPHPFLVSLVGFARTDRLPGKHPLAFF